MSGSDHPHGDGVWPESSKYIEEQFGHLPADVAYKITCENAGKFYVAAACLVDHAAKIIENCVVQADRDLGLAGLRSLSSGLFHNAPSGACSPSLPRSREACLPSPFAGPTRSALYECIDDCPPDSSPGSR